jgi:hypothetical protein
MRGDETCGKHGEGEEEKRKAVCSIPKTNENDE